MRELEATPWPDVLELMAYWTTFPPVHVLVKNGFFKEAERPKTLRTEEELQAAIKDF